MNEIEIIDIARDSLYTLVLISAPAMAAALIVGLVIALFQALTQIQEMTLTFVPKIVAVFITLIIFMPFMLNTLVTFSDGLYERIGEIGNSDPGR